MKRQIKTKPIPRFSVIKCEICDKSLLYYRYYCCNDDQRYCLQCSQSRCRRCSKFKPSLPEQDRLSQSKKISHDCSRCTLPIDDKQNFYSHKKCKIILCFHCMKRSFIKYEKQLLIVAQDCVEIQYPLQFQTCNCEISYKELMEFFANVCFHCGQKISGLAMILKNQTKLSSFCWRNKMSVAQKRSYLKLFNICTACDQAIDGFYMKIGRVIDSNYICQYCSQKTEEIQEMKIKQNALELKKSHVKEAEKNQDSRIDKKNEEKKQSPKVQKNNSRTMLRFLDSVKNRVQSVEVKEEFDALSKVQIMLDKIQLSKQVSGQPKKQSQQKQLEKTQQSFQLQLQPLKNGKKHQIKEQVKVQDQDETMKLQMEEFVELKQKNRIRLTFNGQFKDKVYKNCSKCLIKYIQQNLLTIISKEFQREKKLRIVQLTEKHNKQVEQILYLCKQCYLQVENEQQQAMAKSKRQYKSTQKVMKNDPFKAQPSIFDKRAPLDPKYLLGAPSSDESSLAMALKNKFKPSKPLQCRSEFCSSCHKEVIGKQLDKSDKQQRTCEQCRVKAKKKKIEVSIAQKRQECFYCRKQFIVKQASASSRKCKECEDRFSAKIELGPKRCKRCRMLFIRHSEMAIHQRTCLV